MNDFKRYYILLVLPLKLLVCFYFAANQYLQSTAGMWTNGGFVIMNFIALILVGYVIYYVRHIKENEQVREKSPWVLMMVLLFVPAYIAYWFKYISKEGRPVR